MKHQLSLYVAGRFQTNSTGGYDDCISVDQFAAEHQGFTGPLCKKGPVGNGECPPRNTLKVYMSKVPVHTLHPLELVFPGTSFAETK